MKLMAQGESMGLIPAEGTTYFYVKTNDGYKLLDLVSAV